MDEFTYQQNTSDSLLSWLPGAAIWFLIIAAVLIIGGVFLKKYLYKQRRWQMFLQNRDVPNIIANLSGFDFEVWTQQLFLSLGAKALVTPQRGDHGIDLVVEYNGKKLAIQCKKYYGDKMVGEPAVRDLYGTKWAGKFDHAILITTGNFSRQAITWSQDKKDLMLINGSLLDRIMKNRELLRDKLNTL